MGTYLLKQADDLLPEYVQLVTEQFSMMGTGHNPQ